MVQHTPPSGPDKALFVGLLGCLFEVTISRLPVHSCLPGLVPKGSDPLKCSPPMSLPRLVRSIV